MNYKQLDAFHKFMVHGSVTKTAKAMGVSQPAVSRLLIDLEASLGFPLFYRKRNSISATSEATQFHKAVLRSFIGLDELKSNADAIANAQMGAISVAAQPVYIDTFLIETVAAFNKLHPNVTVSLYDEGHETMLERVSRQNCDFGLGITLNLDRYALEIEPILECKAVCILPLGHPLGAFPSITIDQLNGQDFVDLNIGSPLRSRIDRLFQDAGIYRKINAEARTTRSVCRMVEAGCGIAVSDPFVRLLADPKTTIVRPFSPAISWDVAIFQPANRRLSTVEQSFRQIMKTEVLRIFKTMDVA